MIKKIIIYHFLLFLIVALFSCAKPNQESKIMGQILRTTLTQGLDFWPGKKDFTTIYIERVKQLESIRTVKIL